MKQRRKYSDEDLAEIAARFDTLKDFKREEPSALVIIRTRGLFDKLCGHLKFGHARRRSDGELAEIASRYDNTKEFVENEPSVYATISERGLLEKLCGHMKRMNGENRIPDEELAEVASKYDDLTVFRKKERATYKHIIERGLHHLYSHMKRGVVYHSEEELAAVAARYDTLSVFRKENPNVYDMIRSRGLLEKLCGHMKKSKGGAKIGDVQRKPYTNEELANIAAKYHTIEDFKIKDGGALVTIRKRGLYEELCGHLEKKIRYWTDEELADVASRYDNIKDFRKNESAAYDRILERGLLDTLCAHMVRDVNRYSEEELAAVAAKYDTYQELREKDLWAYKAMRNRGLLDKLCGHLKRAGSLIRRKVYVFTFSDGYAYVGLSLNPEKRYLQHTTWHKRPTAVYRHIKETGATYEFEILTDWLDVDAAGKVEDGYIKQYASGGWKMLNKDRGGALGSKMSKLYTDKRIKKEVAKYEYLRDFRKGSPRFYGYLRNNHLIDKYCSQLIRMVNKNTVKPSESLPSS